MKFTSAIVAAGLALLAASIIFHGMAHRYSFESYQNVTYRLDRMTGKIEACRAYYERDVLLGEMQADWCRAEVSGS